MFECSPLSLKSGKHIDNFLVSVPRGTLEAWWSVERETGEKERSPFIGLARALHLGRSVQRIESCRDGRRLGVRAEKK